MNANKSFSTHTTIAHLLNKKSLDILKELRMILNEYIHRLRSTRNHHFKTFHFSSLPSLSFLYMKVNCALETFVGAAFWMHFFLFKENDPLKQFLKCRTGMCSRQIVLTLHAAQKFLVNPHVFDLLFTSTFSSRDNGAGWKACLPWTCL